jgi:hypothetical protein
MTTSSFLAAAHKLGRPVTVQTAKALPASEPPVPADVTEAAAMAVPIGAVP